MEFTELELISFRIEFAEQSRGIDNACPDCEAVWVWNRRKHDDDCRYEAWKKQASDSEVTDEMYAAARAKRDALR